MLAHQTHITPTHPHSLSIGQLVVLDLEHNVGSVPLASVGRAVASNAQHLPDLLPGQSGCRQRAVGGFPEKAHGIPGACAHEQMQSCREQVTDNVAPCLGTFQPAVRGWGKVSGTGAAGKASPRGVEQAPKGNGLWAVGALGSGRHSPPQWGSPPTSRRAAPPSPHCGLQPPPPPCPHSRCLGRSAGPGGRGWRAPPASPAAGVEVQAAVLVGQGQCGSPWLKVGG